MTRLVLHAGTHDTGWAVVQRQLVSWREPLDKLGVRLHPESEVALWNVTVGELADGAAPEALVEAAKAAVEDGASVLLLGSERLEDALRDPQAVANLCTFAHDLGMPLTVVCVVRDQLGRLNEVYCDRITHLQMARDFASFALDPQPVQRFSYDRAFQAVLESPDVELVAVPYLDLPVGAEAHAILAAAGIAADDISALPAGTSTRPPLPGPVLVAATRLLFKRLWRLALFKSLPRPILLEAAGRLARHASDEGWDEAPFWGWDKALRAEAVAVYQTGNDVLAEAVWGRPWDADWETGVFVDVDFAARPPALVVDMMNTVDAIVQGLVKTRAAANATS